VTASAGVAPFVLPPLRQEAVAVVRWVLLGASAGALAGLLIGGVGGRLAMFVLRLTSSDSVRGLTSDDGFEIGRFSGETLFLLGITTILGGVAGIVYVAARTLVPRGLRVVSWAAVGGVVGGAQLVDADGIDFRLLGPRWLAILMFVAIPTAAAAAMAVWVERWSDHWWWSDRRRTTLAALPATVLLLIPPLPAAVAVVAGLVVVAGRVRTFRDLPSRTPIHIAVGIALLAVVTVGVLALVNDIREIIG
jgi:hypothetical protein